ncbi:MAG TPA: RNase adapter RapZ [Candidatus Anoxymicrobiaceae bacterium]
MEILVITGMSGAGKTQAMKCLEDMGYYAIDNLPASLLPNVIELAPVAGKKLSKIAIVMDIRGGTDFAELLSSLEGLESIPYTIVFLNASDEVLLRRFSETRRIHPLESKGLGVSGLIEEERRLLDPLRERADVVIDTGGMNVYELRETLRSIVPVLDDARSTKISLTSFGYKYGHPLDADIIFDVRFMPNPYWVAELRDRKGTDKRVKDFLLQREDVQEFVTQFMQLIEFILPGYNRERRPYLSIGIGCTGGRHRSVVVTNELAKRFKKAGQPVSVTHRDINK